MPNATVEQNNGPHQVYEMLPHLLEKPLEACLVETFEEGDWRSPERARLGYYRSVREAMYYSLRRSGLSTGSAKSVMASFRRQLGHLILSDLRNPAILSLRESDVRLLRIACKQMAFSSLKLSQGHDEDGALACLSGAKSLISDVNDLIARKVANCPLLSCN